MLYPWLTLYTQIENFILYSNLLIWIYENLWVNIPPHIFPRPFENRVTTFKEKNWGYNRHSLYFQNVETQNHYIILIPRVFR